MLSPLRLAAACLVLAASRARSQAAAPAPDASITAPARGRIVSLERSMKQVWIKKEACGHSSTCDGLLFSGAVLRVETPGGVPRDVRVANIALLNEHVVDCRTWDANWGTSALVAAFSTEEERRRGFDGLIQSVDVSDIAIYPVNLSKMTYHEQWFAASGPGFVAKFRVKLAFSRPVEEDLHAASLCEPGVSGTRLIIEMTQDYGATLDGKTLERFR